LNNPCLPPIAQAVALKLCEYGQHAEGAATISLSMETVAVKVGCDEKYVSVTTGSRLSAQKKSGNLTTAKV
jgi:hypothetical protein